MTALLLVDLSAIYWQTWHAQGPQAEASAPHDGTVRRVRALADRWDYVAICCDSPRNWRREIYPDYKANRKEKPAAAIEQLRAVVDTLRDDDFPIWERDGLEADDVIASAVARAKDFQWIHGGKPIHIDIATGDKDLSQLVSEHVSIISIRDGEMFGVAEVTERYGVPPSLLGDWLALVGDASDNIPGVPGVGGVTATLLLQRYGSLLGIIDAARDEGSELKPKCRESLLASQRTLALARRLVDLRDNADIDIECAFRPRRPKPVKSASDSEMGSDGMEDVDMDGVVSESTDSTIVEPVANTPSAQIVRAGSDDWSLALEPTSPESAWKLSGALANSRLFSGFPNREGLFAAIMLGRTLGVPAMTVLRNTHVIEGKLTLSAQFMVGLILRSGLASYFRCVSRSSESSTWSTLRVGDPEPVSVTWTLEDANRAGLIKQPEAGKKPGNWHKFPAQMLGARASTDLARLVYPDVVGGLYTPDELEG